MTGPIDRQAILSRRIESLLDSGTSGPAPEALLPADNFPSADDPQAQMEAIFATMVKIIDEVGPGYVYEKSPGPGMSCTYVRDGEPSCLFGRVFHALGVPVETLAASEGSGAADLAARIGFAEFHNGVADVMDSVQSMQDAGVPWGIAYLKGVDRARSYWPELSVPPLADTTFNPHADEFRYLFTGE